MAGTWEEYFTGVLYLPPFNGPNEGLIIVSSIHFYNAVMGPAMWTEPCPLYPSVQNNMAFLIFTVLGMVINVVANMYAVLSHVQAYP